MKQIGEETYEHKGISIDLSKDAIHETRNCEGIDIVKLIENAIDRIRYSTSQPPENFKIRCSVENPTVGPDHCQFVINIRRK